MKYFFSGSKNISGGKKVFKQIFIRIILIFKKKKFTKKIVID